MPKGTTKTRFDNIAKEGATVTIEEVNYDDCVRMAAAEAAKTEHGIIVQDTAWDGYEEIPSWIMQGYGTMVMEADQQLKEAGIDRPTHVFVQAGVGSLAGAVVGYFAHKYKENPPVMVVCEASAADCLGSNNAIIYDSNEICVDNEYELFYWNMKWISLGRKFAVDNKLHYDDVPKGALLWLKNHTQGKEERIFTYKDRKQVWW